MNQQCCNHPAKGAWKFCASCGRPFCWTCLSASLLQNYYCKNQACQTALESECKQFEESLPETQLVRSLLAQDETLVHLGKGVFPLPWYWSLMLPWLAYFRVKRRRCLVGVTDRQLHLVALVGLGMSVEFHYSWPLNQVFARKLDTTIGRVVFALESPTRTWLINFPPRAPRGLFSYMGDNVPRALEIYATLTGLTAAQVRHTEAIKKMKRSRRWQRAGGWILTLFGAIFLLLAIPFVVDRKDPEALPVLLTLAIMLGGPGVWLLNRGRRPVDGEEKPRDHAA